MHDPFPLRQTLLAKRRLWRDAGTGVSVVRVSGFPTINYAPYFDRFGFTPHSQTVMFNSFRQLTRGSDTDVLSVDVDGLNLRQISNAPGAR